MKTIKFFVVILALGFLTNSCEKRIFTFSPLATQQWPFPIVNNGTSFNESQVITAGDFNQLLDLPAGISLTDLAIEAIAVNLVANENNQANGVMVSSRIMDGASEYDLFTNFNPSFTNDDENYTALNNLNSAGVNFLKNKILAYLKGEDFEPFSMSLYGAPTPLGNEIDVMLKLKITFSVPYNECLEVPNFMEGGDPC